MPVVCVRLSEEAVSALEAKLRPGQDRSAWLRDLVLTRLGLAKDAAAVEAIVRPPAAVVHPLVEGDRIQVVDPAAPFG